MRALVLGGTGRIGSEVSGALLRRGAEVTILCRSASSRARAEQLGARSLRGDIASPEAWSPTLAGFDAVVHVAASFDADMARVDRRLIRCLIENLAGRERPRRLLYTGGVWLYGDCPDGGDENTPYDPPPGWGWAAEHAGTVARARGVEGLVLHPANVVDEQVGVPPLLLEAAREAGEVRLPGPVSATWPLVGLRDLGELYALVLEEGSAGQAYIGASEPGVSLDRLGARVARLLNLTGTPVTESASAWVSRYGSWASGYGLSQRVSSARAETLGWEPRFRFPG